MNHGLAYKMSEARQFLRRFAARPGTAIITVTALIALSAVGFWSYKQWFRTSTLLTGETQESSYFQDLSYQLSSEYGGTVTILPAWSGDADEMRKVLTPAGISYVDQVKDRDFSLGRAVVATHPLLFSHVCLLWGGRAESYDEFIQIHETGTLDDSPNHRSQYIINHEEAHCIQSAMPSWKSGLADKELEGRISEIIDLHDDEALHELVSKERGISLHEEYMREAFADLYAMHKLRFRSPKAFRSVMERHFSDRRKDAEAGQFSHLTQFHMLVGARDLEGYQNSSPGEFAESVVESIRQRSDAGFLDYLIVGHVAATLDASMYDVLHPERFRDAKKVYLSTSIDWPKREGASNPR